MGKTANSGEFGFYIASGFKIQIVNSKLSSHRTILHVINNSIGMNATIPKADIVTRCVIIDGDG